MSGIISPCHRQIFRDVSKFVLRSRGQRCIPLGAGCCGCSPRKEKCRETQSYRGDRGCSAESRGGCCSGRLRRSGLRSGQQLQGPARRGGEVSSSGPDDDGAWLQVGAAALKHCVASGCILEATLLLEHDQRAGDSCRWGPARSQGTDTITVELISTRRHAGRHQDHLSTSVHLVRPAPLRRGSEHSHAPTGCVDGNRYGDHPEAGRVVEVRHRNRSRSSSVITGTRLRNF